MFKIKKTAALFFSILSIILITGFLLPLYAQPAKLIYLNAHPPEGTKAVKFFIDDIQYAELTDLYAVKTNNKPIWKTAIDPEWLDKGVHQIRMEAESASGTITTEKSIINGTYTPVDTNNRMLNGAWEFAAMDDLPEGALNGNLPAAAMPKYTAGNWAKIFVPHSLGAIDEKWNKYEGIIGVYRRTVDLHYNKNEQFDLLLQSCYWSGRVFINGKDAGETHGGYLPARFNISNFINQGENEIAIVVDNRFSTMGVFKRINDFYWNWGGLMQEVSIEKHSLVSLQDLRAEGRMNGDLQLHLTGNNATNISQTRNITVEVYDAANKKVLSPVTLSVKIPEGTNILSLKKLHINNPVLWQLEKPYLYTVVVTENGISQKEKTGFRDVKVKGSDVIINGKVVEDLQGFDRHADYPGLGKTQPGGLVYAELKELHDKGFRIFRPAHYPTTPAELDAADELGLLVIEEVNVTGMRGAVLGSKEVKDFAAQQLTKMINRDRSHPSLIAYSVGNENFTEEEGAADYVGSTIGLGRSLDSNRLYTQVTHRHTTDKTFAYQDFVAQNYYSGWYAKDINSITSVLDAVQAYAGNKPILLSEYGAEAIPGKAGTSKGTEFYQGFVVDAHNRLLNNRKHFLGKLYWCSTEFWCRPNWSGGNPEPSPPFHYKSLISQDRQFKKLGWRVMFSPVRIILNPHTVKANDLGGDIIFPADKDTSISQVITIKEIRGKSVKGKMLLELPEGFSSEKLEYPFEIKPEEGQSITITIKGKLVSPATSADCFIKAIIDEDTEAQPLLLKLRTKASSN